jgi:hypothetical protein
MQALQISDLNINPLITRPPPPPTKGKKSIAINGFRTPNTKLFFYYGEQLGYVQNTSLIICSQGKLYIYLQMQKKRVILSKGEPPPPPGKKMLRCWDWLTLS